MKTKYLISLAFLTVFIFIQAVPAVFEGRLDLGTLENYAAPEVPEYIFLEEVFGSEITDEVATLGRVLFYDKHLSLNESISCASCHQQEFAFGDTLVASPGFDKKLTERRSTRLLNLNYNHMPEVFWDRRAATLDSLPIMVLSNAIEMGFSGENGQPSLDSLINRLEGVTYYEELFEMAYGDETVTAERVNLALTEFVRSIVSYDSKYDIGRSMVQRSTDKFPNFTYKENLGKDIYFSDFSVRDTTFRRMGCADCHGIDNFTSRKTSLTGNNGIIGVIDHPGAIDTTVKRSPSLRDLVNPEGIEIGPFMHDGSLKTLDDVMEHYSTIGLHGHDRPIGLHTSLIISPLFTVPTGTYTGPATGAAGPSGPIGIPFHPPLPPRLQQQGKDALVAFLKTLTGNKIYTEPKWSDPFNAFGELVLTDDCDNLATTNIQVEICEGDTYEGFHTEGIHRKRMYADEGCDSIIIIDLKVNKLKRSYQEITICESERYDKYGAPGDYVDIFPSSSGCDSIRFLTLDVMPLTRTTESRSICADESFNGYSDVGSFIDTIPHPTNGCYIQRTTRIFRPWLYSSFVGAEICEGDSFNGHTTEGRHIDTIDCRTRLITDIRFVDYYTSDIEQTICEGESYEGYDVEGEYTDHLVSKAGCDSIRTLHLTILRNSESHQDVTICEGDSFIDYSTAGHHMDIFPNAVGCDSIRHINLTVLERPESYITQSICRGETFFGYDESGEYKDILRAVNGCDSIRHLNLEVVEPSYSYIEKSICRGDSYEGYNSAGLYIDRLSSSKGCDSVRTIELNILEESGRVVRKSICQGETYEGYSEEGRHVDIFVNAVGCDSVRTLELTLLDHSYSEGYYEICQGDNLWGYKATGDYSDILSNAAGCDSTRVLHLTVLEHSESYEEIHLCPGETFEGRTEGDYYEIYNNNVGCDSIRNVSIINISPEDAICTPSYDESVKMMQATDYIKVGPNPVVDYLTVTIDKLERQGAKIMIYNASQQLIYTQQLTGDSNTTDIDFTTLDPGLYLVQLNSGNNTYLEKIIKL